MIPAALVAVAAAPAPAPAGDLAQVQRHLQALSSMQADFLQRDRAGKVLTGTLTLKRPGKIRFQYQKGVPVLIVGDGSALYFIDYSVNQVQRWPIGGSPLGVLLDPNKDIARYARIVSSEDDSIIQVEASDPRHPEYGRITLIFRRVAGAPAGLMLLGWVSLDAQNNRTTIQLKNQRFNMPVSDNNFRFNDPRSAARRNR